MRISPTKKQQIQRFVTRSTLCFLVTSISSKILTGRYKAYWGLQGSLSILAGVVGNQPPSNPPKSEPARPIPNPIDHPKTDPKTVVAEEPIEYETHDGHKHIDLHTQSGRELLWRKLDQGFSIGQLTDLGLRDNIDELIVEGAKWVTAQSFHDTLMMIVRVKATTRDLLSRSLKGKIDAKLQQDLVKACGSNPDYTRLGQAAWLLCDKKCPEATFDALLLVPPLRAAWSRGVDKGQPWPKWIRRKCSYYKHWLWATRYVSSDCKVPELAPDFPFVDQFRRDIEETGVPWNRAFEFYVWAVDKTGQIELNLEALSPRQIIALCSSGPTRFARFPLRLLTKATNEWLAELGELLAKTPDKVKIAKDTPSVELIRLWRGLTKNQPGLHWLWLVDRMPKNTPLQRVQIRSLRKAYSTPHPRYRYKPLNINEVRGDIFGRLDSNLYQRMLSFVDIYSLTRFKRVSKVHYKNIHCLPPAFWSGLVVREFDRFAGELCAVDVFAVGKVWEELRDPQKTLEKPNTRCHLLPALPLKLLKERAPKYSQYEEINKKTANFIVYDQLFIHHPQQIEIGCADYLTIGDQSLSDRLRSGNEQVWRALVSLGVTEEGLIHLARGINKGYAEATDIKKFWSRARNIMRVFDDPGWPEELVVAAKAELNPKIISFFSAQQG